MKTICQEPFAVERLLKADAERKKQRFARRHRAHRFATLLFYTLPFVAVLLVIGIFRLALTIFQALR